jgi:geranylgeranyl diphosphate synthase type II
MGLEIDFQKEWEQRTEQIEEEIHRFLPKEQGYQKTVLEAMNYSVLAGGKRLRPLLLCETYRLFGGRDAVVWRFAAAVEMIHTYSLVHDDLPAMDNDEYRRGKKTTHRMFGHAMGILAGDALLNGAFEVMLGSVSEIDGTIEERAAMQGRILEAALCLAERAGINGMLGGQAVDVEATEKQDVMTEDKLAFIYRLKTGALIEGSMEAGAILAGARRQEQEQVRQIASEIGMAFQIQDDILDVESSTEVLGKPVLSDIRNKKTTYVTMKGLEQAKADVERILAQAVGRLSDLEGDKEFLRKLLCWLVNRKN